MTSPRPSSTAQTAITDISSQCLLMRTRLISRVLTGLYDKAFREFGINAPQLSLLVVIHKLAPVSRAEIGRYYCQERSTLTRNLKLMAEAGWIAEDPSTASGRARPMIVTAAGIDLLTQVAPAWRKAQAHTKALLGATNVAAIEDIAQRLKKAKPAG